MKNESPLFNTPGATIKHNGKFIFLLSLFISFPTLVGVFISPALPAMASYFAVSAAQSQPLMGWYLLGFALAQLLYPPFLNRFGRKPPLYISLYICMGGLILSILAFFIHSFSLLLFARIVTALGAASCFPIMVIIATEFFSVDDSKKALGYLMASVQVVSILGIVLSGMLTDFLGWQSLMFFLFFYSIILLFLAHKLPETTKEYHHDALEIKKITCDYIRAFSYVPIIIYGIVMGFTIAILYVLAGIGPFIGIKTMGLSPTIYASLLILPYGAQILGAIYNTYMGKPLKSHYPILWVFASVITGSLIMLISFLYGHVNVFTFFGSLSLIMFGMPIAMSRLLTLAISGYDKKGTAVPIVSSVMIGLAALLAGVPALLPTITPALLPVLFILFSMTSVIIMAIYEKSKQNI